MEGVPVVWNDPDVDWGAYDLVVVRTTWDYPNKIGAFLEWADRVAAFRPLWNSAAMLRWNTDKRYLGELADRGVPIVPTRWFERGSSADLAALSRDEGWETIVLKPVVSAGARRTRLAGPESMTAGQAFLSEQLTQRAMMAQPYVAEVSTTGELSLLYFNGRFSHAVRKIPGAGDFRVQTEHGGKVLSVDPTTAELDAGHREYFAVVAPLHLLRQQSRRTHLRQRLETGQQHPDKRQYQHSRQKGQQEVQGG